MTKQISVIIPAYNEERFITDALDALECQTFPRNEFEVIVVDNASTDSTALLARQHGADKIICESKKGTNQARQTGLNASRGRIVAFLDADCVPPPGWLDRIYEKLTEKKTTKSIATALGVKKQKRVAIAGAYVFYSEMTNSLYIMQEIYRWIVMPTLGSVMGKLFQRGGVVIGGNFATLKKNFKKIGGIDTTFEFFGDDASIARRFGELGYVEYDPRLYVMTSDRRFKREGLMKTNWEYAKNYFKVMLETKS
ncbi:glycosyltransferase [Candidatus Uhrbacteria bacterium]|nr:glycosyltransferase [Candidatus Uhrbacteria bacterium]